MRKLFVLSLLILAVSCMAGILYAEEEMYWDSPTLDPTITEKDFKLDYRVRSTPSFGDQEIYDDFRRPDWDSPEAQTAAPDEDVAPAAPLAPIQPARPALRSNAAPRSLTIQRPADRTPPTPTPSATQTGPKPAETSPLDEAESVIPRSDSRTQIQGNENKGGAQLQPASKKMRWGQAETQKADQKSDDQQKFQWGRKPQ
jgi:hypothetical protein